MPTTHQACKLANRGVLSVAGADRSAFLQGLISNDIGICQPDKPLYAALLTPQGKFLHDFCVYSSGDVFLVECEKDRAGDLLQRLSTFKLRAKVTLENVSDRYDVWAFMNALSAESDGVPLPLAGGVRGGLENKQHNPICTSPPSVPPASGGEALAVDPRHASLGYRGVYQKDSMPANVSITDASAYDRARLALGIPDGSRDMVVGKDTLLDGNFDFLNGISWTKGCYIGQELTARMHHRALIKKRMFPVKISGAAPPSGSPVSLNGIDVGEMRSSNGDLGLALLNIEQTKRAMSEGTPLDSSKAKLTPYQPDWLKI